MTTDLADYAARQIAEKGNRTCGHPGARQFMNFSACPDCTPAKLAGHPEPPEPRCAKPLLCYGPCCVVKTEPPPDERRHQLDEEIEAWRGRARAEIMTLAHLGTFGPRDLAALLPVKLAQGHAREWLTRLLHEGVNAGALVQIDATSWRARRDGEAVQHIELEQSSHHVRVDSSRVERDNRYQ